MLRPFEERYELPPIVPTLDSPEEIARKQQRIEELKKARNAVILAHNYQREEVQEVGDFVGDSLGLSLEAAATQADVIVFCGVHFMAETAAILSPHQMVLLPNLAAQCSLAASITQEELRAFKKRHPDTVVVSYINTSAAIKAESDYCCTSANAVQVIEAIPPEREILFLPDKFLASVVARQTKRSNIIAYPGYCHVHKTIQLEDVSRILDEHPEIELLLHPECGCVSSCMARVYDGTLPEERTYFFSTEGMVRYIGRANAREFAVGTEVGILHRLRKAYPEKTFYPVNPNAICAFMKSITLDHVIEALETLSPRVTVPPEIAERAAIALNRMLELRG
ncbi:MAG: quinolinate synthase NadA [Deltaproteobacteria bacterium]|nr:MAG: quinolinate synthase NadA [Deltaproteobacteria bacterium]